MSIASLHALIKASKYNHELGSQQCSFQNLVKNLISIPVLLN